MVSECLCPEPGQLSLQLSMCLGRVLRAVSWDFMHCGSLWNGNINLGTTPQSVLTVLILVTALRHVFESNTQMAKTTVLTQPRGIILKGRGLRCICTDKLCFFDQINCFSATVLLLKSYLVLMIQ